MEKFEAITPEVAKELTEQEEETLATLKEYVNAELKTEYEKGKTVNISLTGLVKEKQPVEEKFVTQKIIKMLIEAFQGEWNIEEKVEGPRHESWLEFSAKEPAEEKE